MAVMYEQLAKLNKERESLARTQADTATTTRDINIANETANLEKQEGYYNKITSDILKSKNLTDRVIENIAKIEGNEGLIKNIEDVKTYLESLKKGTQEYEAFDKAMSNMWESGDTLVIKNIQNLLTQIELINKSKTELKNYKLVVKHPSLLLLFFLIIIRYKKLLEKL